MDENEVMDGMQLLSEVMVNEIENLGSMDVGTKEHNDTIDNIVKISRQITENQKINADLYSAEESRKLESERIAIENKKIELEKEEILLKTQEIALNRKIQEDTAKDQNKHFYLKAGEIIGRSVALMVFGSLAAIAYKINDETIVRDKDTIDHYKKILSFLAK